MRNENIKKTVYLFCVVFVVVVLLMVMSRINDNLRSNWQFNAVANVTALFLILVGMVIGSHNVIRQLKKDGPWTIDYVVLVLFILVFIFTNAVQTGMPAFIVVPVTRIWNSIEGIRFTAGIGSGYLLTLVFVKSDDVLE